MKILILSDLHRNLYDDCSYQNKMVNTLLNKHKDIDLIVISGDVHEYSLEFNPYVDLDELFHHIPTLFCLGNHEFAGFTVDSVLNHYRNLYNPMKFNVHCLDVLNYFDVDGYRFLGNVLWYDGSMKSYPDQSDVINSRWLDSTIIDFDWKKENKRCVDNIVSNMDDSMIQILVTHCVPHYDLNLHNENHSIYNMYSGMNTFLEDYKFDYSISGHTHRMTIGKIINGCKCINVGNDYGELKHFLLDTSKF